MALKACFCTAAGLDRWKAQLSEALRIAQRGVWGELVLKIFQQPGGSLSVRF